MPQHRQNPARGELQERCLIEAVLAAAVVSHGVNCPGGAAVCRTQCVGADGQFGSAEAVRRNGIAVRVRCAEHGSHPHALACSNKVAERSRLVREEGQAGDRLDRPTLPAVV